MKEFVFEGVYGYSRLHTINLIQIKEFYRANLAKMILLAQGTTYEIPTGCEMILIAGFLVIIVYKLFVVLVLEHEQICVRRQILMKYSGGW